MNALVKKLLIKPGKGWLFYHAPAHYLDLLQPLPEGVTTCTEVNASFDGIQFFVNNSDDLKQTLNTIAPLLKNDTVVWVSYPKKKSGIKTDLEMTGNWDELARYNLEVVAAASIDDTWTALRIRHIGLAKTTGVGNNEIRTNEYAAYVDVDNKIITLPPDAEAALKAEPEALALFNTLAYSHKKEYVLWILTAKQEKTRTARLAKMVEMLLAKKKNPSWK